MPNPKSLFRESALARLSSPEQLDVLMQVTSPRYWIALATLLGLIVTAVCWGFLGSVPTQVQGQSIFTRSGGLHSVTVANDGRVTDLSVGVGDTIRQGQLVARLAQPELLDRLSDQRGRRSELSEQLNWLRELVTVQQDLRREFIAKQRENLSRQIETFEARLDAQQTLLEDGLITRQDYLATREKVQEARSQLQRVSIEELEKRKDIEREINTLASELADVERKLVALSHQLRQSGQVLSPYSGRVVELQAAVGTLIPAGSNLLTLERTGRRVQSLEATLYVSAQDGKRISPGQEALMSPAGVKREEFGLMKGHVASVSEYPVTRRGMMRRLQNEALVDRLLSSGTVFEVRVLLARDPDTPSGFEWTSAEGPPHRITSGNLGTGEVTVREQRPISLVIPMLRQWTGV